jgi:hypothetical protein
MTQIFLSTTDQDVIVATLIEQASAHQMSALACIRESRDPKAGPLSDLERHLLHRRALAYLQEARVLLLRAQQASRMAQFAVPLSQQLAQLSGVVQQLEDQEPSPHP